MAGGLALTASFPPVGCWLLAPIAVCALTLTVRGVRPLRSYLLGFLFALAFLVPLLTWSEVAGVDGWLILSVTQALILALVAPATTLVQRLHVWPAWVACVWVLAEAVRDRVPFGGFPWGRVAFSQGDSPFTPLAALGGAPLVTAAVALAGALLAAAALGARPAGRTRRARGRRERMALVGLAAGAVLVTLAGLAVPLPTTPQHGDVVVAAVQGNVPRTGLDAFGQRRAVLRNHVAETERLAAQAAAGRVPQPDLVLWPENSSDLDPFVDAETAALLTEAARAVRQPILVGAVLRGPGKGHVRNTGLVWNPDGTAGPMYVKRHPVPFAEYLPFRSVLQSLVHRYADDLPNDFLPGRSPGVLTLRNVPLADVICFEVAYDNLVRDAVDGGGRVIVVQTNNATFGRTGETWQQLAMSRLRAVEHGRSVVVVATSGVSALIMPDGRIIDQSRWYTPDALVASLPLRSSRTVADRVGAVPEMVLAAFAVAVLAVAVRLPRTQASGAGGPRTLRWVAVRRRAQNRHPAAPRGEEASDGQPARSGVHADL
ncbi:MAG: apolipoprotein N-acyltransferase [Frankiaceae bacterium]